MATSTGDDGKKHLNIPATVGNGLEKAGKWWLSGMPLGGSSKMTPQVKAIMGQVLAGKLSKGAAQAQINDLPASQGGSIQPTTSATTKATTRQIATPTGQDAATAAAAKAYYAKNTPKATNDPLATQAGDAMAKAGLTQHTPITTSEQVKQVQTILRNHGYDVTVDGIEGPQTRSAIADMQSGKGNAGSWNKTVSPSIGSTSPTTSTSAAPTTTPVQTGAPGAVTGAGKPAATSAATTTTGSGGSTAAPQTLAQTLADMFGPAPTPIDVKSFLVNALTAGKDQAGAEYNPQISAAQQALTDAAAQGKVNMADLTKWFGDASGLQASGTKEANQIAAQGISEQGAANKGILAAFGGNAGVGGAQIAGQASADSNDLINQQQTDGQADTMMSGIIGALGASTKAGQLNTDNTNIADIKSQLQSLIAAKALGVNTDTTAAQQQNLGDIVNVDNTNNANNAAYQNEVETGLLLPGALTGQGLKNNLTTADIVNKGASTAKDKADTTATVTNEQLKSYLAGLTGDKDSASIKAMLLKNHIDAGTYNAKAINYISGLIKASGTTDPAKAVQLAKIYGAGLGVSADPSEYEYSSILSPALTAAGVSGYTPSMFGLGTPAAKVVAPAPVVGTT